MNMKKMTQKLMQQRTGDRALNFLAFALGALLLFHGVDKLVDGIVGIENLLIELNVPAAHYLSYGVYIGEVLAPIFLIMGIFIRYAAAVVIVNMLVAIILVHRELIFTLGEYGEWSIETPVLYLVMAIALVLWDKA